MSLYRNTYAEIDLNKLKNNLNNIMDRAGSNNKMILCVKADAYGHGAVPVSKTAIEAGAAGLAVELPEEGEELRKNGINSKIIVMGRANPKQMELSVKYDLEQCVADAEDIEILYDIAAKNKKTAYVQLKIDTGMGRIGVNNAEELNAVLEKLKELNKKNNLTVLKGVFTHFARADERNKDFTYLQAQRFNNYINIIKQAGFVPEIHCSNSAAGISMPNLNKNYYRCGIAAYGYQPSKDYTENKPLLTPVMTVYSEISQIKDVPENFPIGYNSTFYTSRPSKIATVQIGYADGFNRSMSNKGRVIIKSDECSYFAPIVGRICMDQAMIDITDIPNIKKGDIVTIMGEEDEKSINADDMAEICGTISYEILTSYSKRVPRIYLK